MKYHISLTNQCKHPFIGRAPLTFLGECKGQKMANTTELVSCIVRYRIGSVHHHQAISGLLLAIVLLHVQVIIAYVRDLHTFSKYRLIFSSFSSY